LDFCLENQLRTYIITTK